jgi:hypothetical protein
VAQYGDACNLFAFGPQAEEQVRHKLDVLREHCQRLGRSYDQIEKTSLGSIAITADGRDNSLTPEAAVAYFRSLAALGIDHAIFSLTNVADLEPFDLLATKVVPEVEKIETARQ